MDITIELSVLWIHAKCINIKQILEKCLLVFTFFKK